MFCTKIQFPKLSSKLMFFKRIEFPKYGITFLHFAWQWKIARAIRMLNLTTAMKFSAENGISFSDEVGSFTWDIS